VWGVAFPAMPLRERVATGTDCGMMRVHPEICWAKLDSLSAGARLASVSVPVFVRRYAPRVASTCHHMPTFSMR
jgi:hypothetical protein